MNTETQSAAHQTRAGDQVTLAEVHKRLPERVWVTKAATLPGERLRGEFRIPGSDGLPRLSDLMEVQRQAGLLHAHRVLHVPPTRVFVLHTIALSVPELTRLPAGETTGYVTVESYASEYPRDRGSAQRFSMAIGPSTLAVGDSYASFISKPVYERLRRRSRLPRDGAPDLSMSAVTISTVLAPRASDPILDDHTSDHVSAMSMVSSIEQVLLEHDGGWRLNRLALEFPTYAEHGIAPLLLELEEVAEGRFSGSVRQGETVNAVVTLSAVKGRRT